MKRYLLIAAAASVLLAISSSGYAQGVSGDYVETRTADVYTGPCFANSEVNLAGAEAIMAWHVTDGSWDGTALGGLSVVAVVRASGTLGDPFENPYPAKAVLIVDSRANAEQQQALIHFAETEGGRLLANAVRVERAPIDVQIERTGMHPVSASVSAGDLAGIKTRAINTTDHVCGNEDVFYPPLVDTSHAMPAVAVLDQYNGPGLDASWTIRDKRSAFVGSFSREQVAP